jgi:outer membrane protein assembly factor BamE
MSFSRSCSTFGGVAALAALLSGCASSSGQGWLERITPYRIEIVQGNVVTSEQVARVKPGMNRSQVRDVLGTPLLTDPFHGDRWDYLFSIRRKGTEYQQRSVVVWFDGDSMRSIEAPDLPSEREFISAISTSAASGRVPTPRVLELTDSERKALPLPPKREVKPEEPFGPVRSYPPLEGS